MEVAQEFGNERGKFVPSGQVPLKCIEKLPLPYTGNKKKLIYKIHESIVANNLEFNTVLDAFSGSATVSFLFKWMGKKVISNDLLTSSYMNAVAFVENPGIKLSDEEKRFLLHHQNPKKSTFVQDNYLGNQFRTDGKQSRFNKFTLKECIELDNFRANIDELCNKYTESLGLAANAAVVMRLPFGNVDQSSDVLKHRIKQSANYGLNSDQHDRRIGIYYDKEFNLKFEKWFNKYVDDFIGAASVSECNNPKIKRAASLANIQQHILRDCFVGGRLNNGQVISEIDNRLGHQKNQLKRHYSNDSSTELNLKTQNNADLHRPGEGLKWWTFADVQLPGSCLATNMDIITLLNTGFCDNIDCVYFDPPYGGQSSDYPTMYRFLEEYIYSDELENLPHISAHRHKFIKKSSYEEHFQDLLIAAKKIPLWMFSYNDTSWKNIDYICDLIKQHRSDVKVDVLTDEYRYLYRKKQGRQNKSSEYLIIARK